MGDYPNTSFRDAIAKRFGNRFYLRAIIDPGGTPVEITGKNSIVSVSQISQEVPIEVDRMAEVNFADLTLTFNDPSKYLLNTYGNQSSTNIVGKELALRLYIDGQAGYMTVFRGIIRRPFIFYRGYAELTVENIVNQYLFQELRIISTSVSPYSRTVNGSLVDSASYVSAAGIFVGSPITFYAGAQLGQWTITFTSATDFTVTGPGCKSKVGSTLSDFFDATDATDSQVKIPTGCWSGTFQSGDTASFFVSVNIGYDAYAIEYTLATGLYDLLVNYAGMNTDLIDYGGTGIDDYTYVATNSFNLYYYVADAAGFNPVMSFDQPISILEACMQFLQHVCGTLVQMLDGRIRIFTHRLLSETIQSHAGHVISLNAYSLSDICNEVIIYYGWDYTNQTYLYELKYPATDAANASYIKYGKKKTVTIYAPGYYTDTKATALATSVYGQRNDPLRIYDLTLALDSIHMEMLDSFYLKMYDLGNVLDIAEATYPLFVIGHTLNLIDQNNIQLKCLIPVNIGS